MWSDNETTVDLLGFDAVTDELEVVIRDKRLLPVTVLVNGEWGSGKSSLLTVARRRLDAEPPGRFIVVEFTPWRYEDFQFGKVALMASVMRAIHAYILSSAPEEERAGMLDKCYRAWRLFYKYGVVKALAVGGAAFAGLPAEAVTMAGCLTDLVGGITVPPEEKSDEAPAAAPDPQSAADFHIAFEQLIGSLGDDFQALVVLIDDMDRCSKTSTIVDMFEAIRLFLNGPKTAFVVAAQATTVEAALNTEYIGRSAQDKEGSRWLEKMFQQRVDVPPLGELDVRSYINLLFCELDASAEQFEQLRLLADQNRKGAPFGEAMNKGMVVELLGDAMPEVLDRNLTIAQQIGPVLAEGLRGNPRQTKTFLNDLMRRLATAARRGVEVQPDRLAKMMVLEHEKLSVADGYEQLFKWFLRADGGKPAELKAAERIARGATDVECEVAVATWAKRGDIGRWLTMDPPLADVDLGPYFSFARSRLAHLITAPSLSVATQRLLADLQSSVQAVRREALRTVDELGDEQFAELLAPLLDAAFRSPTGDAATSAIALAGQSTLVANSLVKRIAQVPHPRVSADLISMTMNVTRAIPDSAELRHLLNEWSASSQKAVREAGEACTVALARANGSK